MTNDPHDSYLAYIRGWSHGAASRAMDDAFVIHQHSDIREAYNKGFTDGHAARVKAANAYCKSINYAPSVLRLMEE